MIINKRQAAFGRHESFSLRYGWVPKGLQALSKNSQVFNDEDATVELGVGKNMVKAIRYWLLATQLAEQGDERGLCPSMIGENIFNENGWDPYIEDDATIWLMHWLLATNPDYATVFYWFFNVYHRAEFSTCDASDSLSQFVDSTFERSFAPKTMHNDLLILLRMYSPVPDKKQGKGMELESPFSSLGLVDYHPDVKMYQSKYTNRDSIPPGVFGFALTQFFQITGVREVPLEKLAYSQNGQPTIGTVFRLSENGLLQLVEKTMDYIPGVFRYRESAGLRQVYFVQEDFLPLNYLERHYEV